MYELGLIAIHSEHGGHDSIGRVGVPVSDTLFSVSRSRAPRWANVQLTTAGVVDDPIITDRVGYEIQVQAGQLDLQLFRQHVNQAHTAAKQRAAYRGGCRVPGGTRSLARSSPDRRR